MHHLHTCMDAGIRSGRTGDGDRMGTGGRERFFQNLLDSETVDLALPAGIGGTVIFHRKENSLQNSTPFRKIPSSTMRAISSRRISKASQSFFVVFRTRSLVRPSPP